MGEILDSLKISHEQAIGGLILEADLGNLLKDMGGDNICHKQKKIQTAVFQLLLN